MTKQALVAGGPPVSVPGPDYTMPDASYPRLVLEEGMWFITARMSSLDPDEYEPMTWNYHRTEAEAQAELDYLRQLLSRPHLIKS